MSIGFGRFRLSHHTKYGHTHFLVPLYFLICSLRNIYSLYISLIFSLSHHTKYGLTPHFLVPLYFLIHSLYISLIFLLSHHTKYGHTPHFLVPLYEPLVISPFLINVLLPFCGLDEINLTTTTKQRLIFIIYSFGSLRNAHLSSCHKCNCALYYNQGTIP